jgi:putative phosphoesterase
MKIGVISDTHIPDRASDIPEAVLKAFRSVDMIIHAGDLVDARVLERLKEICGNVVAVLGNMDYGKLKEALLPKQVISVGKYKVGIMHGYGRADKLIEVLAQAFKDDRVDLVIFGHSHVGTNITKEGVIYFNPGSPTDRALSPYNSYGIIEINDSIVANIVKF